MRGNQAGLSTFHFSYKKKVFQGTFSEQKPPPKREGSRSKDAVGVQTAQSCCSQLHPLCTTDRNIARAAHLLTLGQPNTTRLSLVRQNRSPVRAMHVSHRKQRGSLPKGALSSLSESPSSNPCWHTCSERADLLSLMAAFQQHSRGGGQAWLHMRLRHYVCNGRF